uniref:Ig-like domain-containing protein n=1 Tax=Labrus bergylta TaxID=56723 RepID=A0A3Q3EX79_9LABR
SDGGKGLPGPAFACKGEDRVIQPTEDVFASEGDTVTLDCKFETTDTTPSLFWYRQEMGDFPKYLWKRISENAPGISRERFNATTNGTSVPLKIQKLQLTDSAVYYCALRPTRGVVVGYKTLHQRVCTDADFRITCNAYCVRSLWMKQPVSSVQVPINTALTKIDI